jgi:hypothetical protein
MLAAIFGWLIGELFTITVKEACEENPSGLRLRILTSNNKTPQQIAAFLYL